MSFVKSIYLTKCIQLLKKEYRFKDKKESGSESTEEEKSESKSAS